MNQSQMIFNYNRDNKIPFNADLFNRTDDDIIVELKKIIISCQRENQYFTIKVDNFRVVDDYAEINQILYDYYEETTKNKNSNRKKDNMYGYINLNESDIKLLLVRYYIKVKDQSTYLNVIIMVPRLVDKYYFKIGGITYSALYQIVDGSTYNNSTSNNAKNPSITMKIVFMATRVYRQSLNIGLTNGETIKCSLYMSRIFNKSVSACKYILAKYGYYGALNFLGLYGINVTTYDPSVNNSDYNDHYVFQKSEDVFISVPKVIYDNDYVTQSFIMTLCKSIIPTMPYEMIFSQDFWIRSLGADFNNYNQEKFLDLITGADPTISDTIDKGNSILDSFESIYDISTRDSIRLPMEDKYDMYCIVRWIMREFNYLKQKDNLDISIKKIRYAHYIASLYAMKIVRGIYRIADLNKKVTIEDIVRAINTAPNYLLRTIVKCKLVNYKNMVNDMDSLVALKYTYKGISGLGESNSNSIPDIFRSVNVSHLGRVDLDASSNTDPGISGTICPFVPIDGGYFTDYQEPNFWETEFTNSVSMYTDSKKLIEPLIFMEKILGKDMTEEKAILEVKLNMMEQLIKPIIFMDEEV